MSKRRSIAIVLSAALVALVAVWCLAKTKETEAYRALLSLYPEGRPLVVSRPSTCMEEKGTRSGVPLALSASFRKANGSRSRPISLLALRWDYDVVDGERLKAISTAGVDIRALLPQGTHPLYLSRVGFSSDGSEGLYCVQRTGGILLVHVRLENGQWKLVRIIPTWISLLDHDESGVVV